MQKLYGIMNVWINRQFCEYSLYLNVGNINVNCQRDFPLLESIHYGWQRLPVHRWVWALLWVWRPMCELHCLPQSVHWWVKCWGGWGYEASWCLRLCIRAAARSYSASTYDIPLAQVALLDGTASSLLNRMLHVLRIDLMWSFKRFLCQPTLLWPCFCWP